MIMVIIISLLYLLTIVRFPEHLHQLKSQGTIWLQYNVSKVGIIHGEIVVRSKVINRKEYS